MINGKHGQCAFCNIASRRRADFCERDTHRAGCEAKGHEICLSRFRIGATGVRVQGDMPDDVDPPEVVHTSRAL